MAAALGLPLPPMPAAASAPVPPAVTSPSSRYTTPTKLSNSSGSRQPAADPWASLAAAATASNRPPTSTTGMTPKIFTLENVTVGIGYLWPFFMAERQDFFSLEEGQPHILREVQF